MAVPQEITNQAPDASQVAEVYAQVLMDRAEKLAISTLPKEAFDGPSDPWDTTYDNNNFYLPPGLEKANMQDPWAAQNGNSPRPLGRQEEGVKTLKWLNEGLTQDPLQRVSDQQHSEQGHQGKLGGDISEFPPNATTMMICNIPCMIMPQQLVTAIDSFGFRNRYDLMYLPPQLCSDERKSANLGYGFVNFKTPADALEFSARFTGYQFLGTCSKKVVTVRIARIQGFEANLKAASRALKHKKKTVNGEQIEYTSMTHSMQGRGRAEPLLLPTWDDGA